MKLHLWFYQVHGPTKRVVSILSTYHIECQINSVHTNYTAHWLNDHWDVAKTSAMWYVIVDNILYGGCRVSMQSLLTGSNRSYLHFIHEKWQKPSTVAEFIVSFFSLFLNSNSILVGILVVKINSDIVIDKINHHYYTQV